jgi:nucleoside-diphosphate-sugar epimerase
VTTLGATSRRPIAVVGATGLQGGATARALLGANAPVRALARRTDSDAARALTELGADLVAADLDDPEGLRAGQGRLDDDRRRRARILERRHLLAFPLPCVPRNSNGHNDLRLEY